MKILQPGRPGGEARTLPPDTEPPASRHNAADVEFMQMMIAHHAQALEMGRLARKRAQDPQVRSMAQRIADSQGAEILSMSAWLERHGVQAPTAQDLKQGGMHGQHAQHTGTMPGMLSPARMQRLEAAAGRRFDELFLRSMIEHHQGAIAMANTALDRGRDIIVAEVATDVSAVQSAEISRMRQLLRRL